jgi:hypothetical protein
MCQQSALLIINSLLTVISVQPIPHNDEVLFVHRVSLLKYTQYKLTINAPVI